MPSDKAATPPAERPKLDAEQTARLTDFARACKAAARAVVLYPGGHPAIAATLGRIVQVTSPPALMGTMAIAVLPDGLLLDGREPPRADPSIGELAALLHGHLIGEILVRPGGDADAWRSFLLLLGRAPDAVRADGGIARAWTAVASPHLEVREINYAEVLKERDEGQAAAWESLITHCLQTDALPLSDDAIAELLGIADDASRLADVMAAIETRAVPEGGIASRAAAILKLLRTIVDAVRERRPERLEAALRNMASAVGQLSPELVLSLLMEREGADSHELMSAVVGRMSEPTIARFVARSIVNEGTATDRLATAFQTLVREGEARDRMLALAKTDVAASPLGSTEGFEEVWDHVAQKLLTSYSDKSFVSDAYGRELSGARAQAIEVEQVSDDPPDRLSAWLATVATSALRSLDLTLLLDLLRIEENEERWGELMTPVVALLEDLLLVGDFDAARQLVDVVVQEAAPGGTKARRQHAMIAIDLLIAGPMMRHVTTHLGSIDDAQFERVKTMMVSLGEVVVRPLAEALSVEERARTRERLTAILLSFGNVGRRTVERLKTSGNALVRRTAIYLMREFGGSDALPDLTELLDDNEPQVQREAVRAILNIGTDAAYSVLQQALDGGTPQTRDAIMQSLSMLRHERATPLFAYILRHVDHRGKLSGVYVRAIESLGTLRDPAAIGALEEALYKGEWWAPRRTRDLRSAAATALSRIGTPEAFTVLEQAARRGPRGVRAIARTHAERARRRAADAETA